MESSKVININLNLAVPVTLTSPVVSSSTQSLILGVILFAQNINICFAQHYRTDVDGTGAKKVDDHVPSTPVVCSTEVPGACAVQTVRIGHMVLFQPKQIVSQVLPVASTYVLPDKLDVKSPFQIHRTALTYQSVTNPALIGLLGGSVLGSKRKADEEDQDLPVVHCQPLIRRVKRVRFASNLLHIFALILPFYVRLQKQTPSVWEQCKSRSLRPEATWQDLLMKNRSYYQWFSVDLSLDVLRGYTLLWTCCAYLC